MFVRMITYDSEYGDAITFDDFTFSVLSFDQFTAGLLGRFDELIKTRALIIEMENGVAVVVDPRSGKSAESYVLAYPCEQDAKNDVYGITLAGSLFYDPETREVSCGFDGYSFWDQFSELNADVIDAWGLRDVLENQPPELDATRPGGPLSEWKLTEFLFDLYQSSLLAKG